MNQSLWWFTFLTRKLRNQMLSEILTKYLETINNYSSILVLKSSKCKIKQHVLIQWFTSWVKAQQNTEIRIYFYVFISNIVHQLNCRLIAFTLLIQHVQCMCMFNNFTVNSGHLFRIKIQNDLFYNYNLRTLLNLAWIFILNQC